MIGPIALVAASSLLVSCAVTDIGRSAATDDALDARLAQSAQQTDAGRATREGMRALLEGDARLASKAFSRAIKLDPENAQLHLLNAVAYHLGYAQGSPVNRDLAETGYFVALRLDPNNVVAAQMLGQLYLDSGRYYDARHWIGTSLLLGESSAHVYHALAVASYYTQDLRLALWAISEAERRDENSSAVLRAGAMIRAAAGQFDAAEERRQRYDNVEKDALLRRSLNERVAQWRTALTSLNDATRINSGRSSLPGILAQAPATGPAPASAAAQPVTSGPLAPNWSDCAPPGQPSGTYGAPAGAASGSADETTLLPPLPSPCAGRPLPRMAVIDVAIIRSQDTSTTKKGINLLESLSVTFGGELLNYQRTYVANRINTGSSIDTKQVNRALTATLGSALGGITYSLNIANAMDQANEVIARPSLLVLDRQPSTFFSGSNLSTAIAGTLGGGNRIDHPVGVSLSVTPTFIDDESMLLAVKAGRSFFQDSGPLNLSNDTVQSSRNVASANVRIRFNETLVLSGLSEREIQETESGVPVLKDVPLLQYLFKTESTLNYNHSILVLLTPRRTESTGDGLRLQGLDERASPEVQELRARAGKWLVPTHNLDVIIANLDRKNLDSVGLFRQFRTGDLRAQVWNRPARMQRILSEIASFLYY